MKTYKNIIATLKKHVRDNTQVLWTWKKGKQEEFTLIYKNYGNDLQIYTSEQLIKEIEIEQNKKIN
tara:strand:- start:6504 stop:6701 length:198 start_codon:yes stop_codon:yes gene_type:complete